MKLNWKGNVSLRNLAVRKMERIYGGARNERFQQEKLIKDRIHVPQM